MPAMIEQKKPFDSKTLAVGEYFLVDGRISLASYDDGGYNLVDLNDGLTWFEPEPTLADFQRTLEGTKFNIEGPIYVSIKQVPKWR